MTGSTKSGDECPAWMPTRVSLRLTRATNDERKGGGTPTSALSILRAIGRGARSSQTVHASPRTQSTSERARLSAFHRGSRLRDCSSPRLSVGPCFLGRGRSVRSYTAAPTGGRRPRAAPRALPRAVPVPVQWCTPRAGRSAGGMMPKPPGNGPYPPARGHRTRSAFRNTFAKGVLRRANSIDFVTELVTNVKPKSLF